MLYPRACFLRLATPFLATLLFACTDDGADGSGAALLERLDPPAGPGAMAPSLVVANGTPVLSWLEPAPEEGVVRLLASRFSGQGWLAPVEIAASAEAFANWADFPAIAAAADGSLLAHWLRRTGTTSYAYTIELQASRDGGATWSAQGSLPTDTSPTEHGFLSAAATGGASLEVFWLDGREMVPGGPGEGAEEAEGPMTLRTARLDAPWEAPSDRQLLDDRVCECCQTDAAMTTRGPIVVYRDRSPIEVRDIAIVRHTESGWSEPEPIHEDRWSINGCPVNGPAVAAQGNLVAVAWFTAPDGWPAVEMAFSQDAGASFTPPLTLDEAHPLGRLDLVLEPDGTATVVWLARSGGHGELRLVRVRADGAVGAPFTVASTSTGRASGFPRLAHDGESLWIAWTEASEPSHLRAGRLGPSDLERLDPP